MENDIRAAATCAVIVLLFCLAWLPYATVALLGTFGRSDLVTPYASSLPALFAKSSAVYNPIVYAVMNQRFRNALRNMFGLGERPSNTGRHDRSPNFTNKITGYTRGKMKAAESNGMPNKATGATHPPLVIGPLHARVIARQCDSNEL
nr:rhabdomeric opsin [Dactylobiotus sp.]